MSCSTCGYTMFRLNTRTGSEWFWCRSCGTLREVNRETGKVLDDDRPKLVNLCRQFANCRIISGSPDLDSRLWQSLGIAESINLPANRPIAPEGARQ